MKYLLIAFCLFFISFSAFADKCAFRISSGELIRCGMSKIEVMNHLGQPELTNTESLGVNDGFGQGGQTVESWSYVAVGDIGGEYYLTVRFAESKVIGIESEQVNR